MLECHLEKKIKLRKKRVVKLVNNPSLIYVVVLEIKTYADLFLGFQNVRFD